ncbi:hypothetical protein V499_07389 [Pseudogymnoascus sp. VKM F-103]|nr:hypothetical protein V499_07389 [Pseudogymnoascus sp. VKM F-103]
MASTTTESPAVTPKYPIIDSHIHIYPASEVNTLAWFDPNLPLSTNQHSLEEYTAATTSPPELEGFVFLETDREHDLDSGEADGSGWAGPLMEVDWIRRVAVGEPKEGEGHDESHAKLVQGFVPWAPLPSGAAVVERYIEKAREVAGEEAGKRISGFRYLVQSKPPGTMLGEGFIEGLKLLGREKLTFDLGVDQHNGGDWQLEEAVEMVKLAHEGVEDGEKVRIVINHLCKPDFSFYALPPDELHENPRFQKWSEAMFKLSQAKNTYMKLSGCLSELPDSLKTESANHIFAAILPWLSVILAAFRGRLMFGSDWPVCTVGVGEDAWKKWRAVVERMCEMGGFGMEEQIMLWSGTAIVAYGLNPST